MKALPNRFTFVVTLLIVIGSAGLCRQVILLSTANQRYKNAYAELHHVKYGFLSVDEWKRQVSAILSDEIRKMYLTKRDERELRRHVEVLLNTLIDEADQKIRAANKGSAKGWVRQTLMDIFIDLEDIKKGIPEYADAVVREMTKSKTRGLIKGMLKKRLAEYSGQTFNTLDSSQINRILDWVGDRDVEIARSRVDGEIRVRHARIVKASLLLILLSFAVFGLSGFGGEALSAWRALLLVLPLLLLLVSGVTTPMIDLEAKISRISLVLMGHPIHFENQVLYFQSKSILDVFWILVTNKDIPMKFVGILLVTFSVVFPLSKIFSSWLYYFDVHGARRNPVILFFVFRSGKWSMADVMVVAIFMAYIGFNGMITSQFGQLNATGRDLMILATNGTSLQPGYYLFLTYALLAMVFSGILARLPQKTPSP